MDPENPEPTAPGVRHGRLWSALAAVAILLSLLFVASFIRSNWEDVRRVPAGLDPAALGLYLLITAGYFLYQGLVWKLMFEAHGYPVGARRVLTMYFSAILLAYVPGKIAASLGIAALARTARIPASVSVYLFLRAQLMFLFAGAAAAVTLSLLVPADSLFPTPVRLGLAGATIAALAVALASRSLLRRGLMLLLRVARIDAKVVPVSRAVWLRDLGLLYVSWFVYGIGFWWLVRACAAGMPAIAPLAWVSLTLVMSYLGAYIAVFVPAGLGILEAGLIVGLDRILPPGAAVWVAVGHRIFTVLLAVLLLGALLGPARAGRLRAPNDPAS